MKRSSKERGGFDHRAFVCRFPVAFVEFGSIRSHPHHRESVCCWSAPHMPVKSTANGLAKTHFWSEQLAGPPLDRI